MTHDNEWTDWIAHDGGECPVPLDEEVAITNAAGLVYTRSADNFIWNLELADGFNLTDLCVVKYRRRKSTVASQAQSALNSQIGGDHYKKLVAYQPIEVIRRWLTPEEFRGYIKGTAIAYLAREQDKGGDQDISKAGHTIKLWEELK